MLENYLTGRKQFVQINEIKSGIQNITCGVPQGSILGPTLFLLYVEDIFELQLHGNIQLFADDTALVYGCETLESLKFQMESDLKVLNSWFNDNHLKLNIKKSVFLQFYQKNAEQFNRNSLNHLMIGSDKIERVDKAMYLGLQLSSHLNWTQHLNNVKQKIAPMVGLFNRVSRYVTPEVLLSLYMAHIQSHLIYQLSIWGGSTKNKISEIQILQNKALKSLFQFPLDYPTKLLYSPKILPLSKLIEYEYILIIYKMKKNLIHITNINEILQTNFSITNRVSRTGCHFHLPKLTTDVAMKSLFFEGVKLYNSLPTEWKDLKIGEFKIKVKIKLYNEFCTEYDERH